MRMSDLEIEMKNSEEKEGWFDGICGLKKAL